MSDNPSEQSQFAYNLSNNLIIILLFAILFGILSIIFLLNKSTTKITPSPQSTVQKQQLQATLTKLRVAQHNVCSTLFSELVRQELAFHRGPSSANKYNHRSCNEMFRVTSRLTSISPQYCHPSLLRAHQPFVKSLHEVISGCSKKDLYSGDSRFTKSIPLIKAQIRKLEQLFLAVLMSSKKVRHVVR